MALVVRDYDEAIDFFTKKLDFVLVELACGNFHP
ncbi:MAG TPA: VOC family protein [Gemmatimonadaceae bacterium]|nr:VOC family protein [Gemmatimonadaceae bacterium]